MSPAFTPLAPHRVGALLCEQVRARPGVVRVALDGPAWAGPAELAAAVAAELRESGRPCALIRGETFWHDASLRYEHGRTDVESRLHWLDAAALRREVLDRVRSDGEYLPSLRDPHSNRATRARRRPAADDLVLIVTGEFLLGRGLPFDLTVHLALSPAARARSAAADEGWLLEAFERYEHAARPVETADVVVRMDHPDRPAVRV